MITNDTLICPRCGGDYLHHDHIDVFNRNREDSVDGLAIMIRDGAVTVSTNAQDHNPSARRNGIRIVFWCEGCNERSGLTIVQHKGQTLIEWE
jgi:hypothetical protein